jgi:hypothetical protein
MITQLLGYEIRKHVHNNRGIITGRNKNKRA